MIIVLIWEIFLGRSAKALSSGSKLISRGNMKLPPKHILFVVSVLFCLIAVYNLLHFWKQNSYSFSGEGLVISQATSSPALRSHILHGSPALEMHGSQMLPPQTGALLQTAVEKTSSSLETKLSTGSVSSSLSITRKGDDDAQLASYRKPIVISIGEDWTDS